MIIEGCSLKNTEQAKNFLGTQYESFMHSSLKRCNHTKKDKNDTNIGICMKKYEMIYSRSPQK